MRKPNFFIIGAPRCGTTAMAKYLYEHPNIFVSKPKEPKYYCHDLGHRVITSQSAYNQLFENVTEQHIAVGEASTSYAYSAVAVSELLREHPDARLIFIVRDPVKAAASLHAHLYSLGVESIFDFSEAWFSQKDRARGIRVPSGCNDPKRLLYGEIYKYGKQLQRVYQSGYSERVLVLFYDDFKKDPRSVYLKVLNFLGVPDDGRQNFERVHALKKIRSWALARTLRGIRNVARRIGIPSGLGIGTRLARLNKKHPNGSELPSEVESEVRRYFDADIVKLANITGRDLSSWRVSVGRRTEPL